jgi:hypothetical protein
MPEFIDFHEGYHNLTQELLTESLKRDRQFEAAEGVHFKRAWADPSTGRMFFLSEAPDKQAVLRVHLKAGHGTHHIFELPYSAE